jgi:site-specific recombinase XerD
LGELRDKMSQEMALRNLAPKTCRGYVASVSAFARFCRRSPAQADLVDVKRYLAQLIREGYAPETIKHTVTALRFLYGVTLGRERMAEAIPYPKVPFHEPEILSGTEVCDIFGALTRLIPGMVLMTMYAAGLRVSEACRLKTADIDSKRGVIHVREGKGRKDRYVMLSARLLEALRAYWRKVRPRGEFLFPGNSGGHVHPETVRVALRDAVRATNIKKRVTTHVLRHSFATHLHETGIDIRVIQHLLGHASIRTTTRYTRVSRKVVGSVKSPLDLLGTADGSILG